MSFFDTFSQMLVILAAIVVGFTANRMDFLDSHANMERYAERETVDCIVFNFGRLPGGDPTICTRAESSVAAIDAGLRLLRPRGVMAIALYYG